MNSFNFCFFFPEKKRELALVWNCKKLAVSGGHSMNNTVLPPT